MNEEKVLAEIQALRAELAKLREDLEQLVALQVEAAGESRASDPAAAGFRRYRARIQAREGGRQ